MSKAVKQLVMDEIQKRLGETRELLVVDASKMDAIETNRMRLTLQEKGVTLLAVKNTLAKRVLSDVGMDGLDDVLEGPSTLVWGGEDIVQLSKEMTKWAKEIPNLDIKGGSVDGQALDAGAVDSLSKSPGRLELLSIISGQLLSPGAQLSGALVGIGGALASQVEKISEEAEGAE